MSDVTRLSALPGLSDWCGEEGFNLEDICENEIVITDRDGGSIWSVFRVGGWLQVKGLVFEDVNTDLPFCLSLARLHGRLLGCRFGLDDDQLWLFADLFPHDQNGSAVGAAIIQMQSIVDSTYDLLLRAQQSGVAADEAAIDEAFELKGDASLH